MKEYESIEIEIIEMPAKEDVVTGSNGNNYGEGDEEEL